MGKDDGYGLRKPAPAVEIGYILGVCLKQDTHFVTYTQLLYLNNDCQVNNVYQKLKEQ
jgi:hypothetical protein